jgi:hypothetical protein
MSRPSEQLAEWSAQCMRIVGSLVDAGFSRQEAVGVLTGMLASSTIHLPPMFVGGGERGELH